MFRKLHWELTEYAGAGAAVDTGDGKMRAELFVEVEDKFGYREGRVVKGQTEQEVARTIGTAILGDFAKTTKSLEGQGMAAIVWELQVVLGTAPGLQLDLAPEVGLFRLTVALQKVVPGTAQGQVLVRV
jgi:hypothetical protein